MGKAIKDKNEDSINRMNPDPAFQSSMEDGSNTESENVRDLDNSSDQEERDPDDQVHQPMSGARPPGMDA